MGHYWSEVSEGRSDDDLPGWGKPQDGVPKEKIQEAVEKMRANSTLLGGFKVADLKVGDFIKEGKEVYEITDIDHVDQYIESRCRFFHDDGTQAASSGTCSFEYMEANKDSFEFLGHKNVFFVSDMRAIIEYKARLDAAGAEYGAMIVGDEGNQVVCPDDVWDEFFERGGGG